MEFAGLSQWPTLGQMLLLITLGLLLSVGSAALTAFVLVRLPATYFCKSTPRDFWINQHPVIRWTGLVIKNILGAFVIALGILLSLPGVPGPGLLTILFGVTLMDFPGKRKLERWVISRPLILNTINRLRLRKGRPPLLLQDIRSKRGMNSNRPANGTDR